jgi:hypothetical protein
VTHVEDRLRELLHEAAPAAVEGVRFDAVDTAARRRGRIARVGALSGVVAVIAGGALAGALLANHGPTDRTAATGPSPTTPSTRPAPQGRMVSFQGVTIVLPPGWRYAHVACGAPDRTVVVNDPTAMCPYPVTGRHSRAIVLTSLYGRDFARGWSGTRTRWQGQPAWLAERRSDGESYATLTLPWLNAAVAAQAPSAVAARRLLDQVGTVDLGRLAVPALAKSVRVTSLGAGGGQRSPVTEVTAPEDVRQLLADLRALPLVRDPGSACDAQWGARTVLLTVPADSGGDRAYAARLDGCGLVVGGTGVAGRVSAALRADLARILPGAALLP